MVALASREAPLRLIGSVPLVIRRDKRRAGAEDGCDGQALVDDVEDGAEQDELADANIRRKAREVRAERSELLASPLDTQRFHPDQLAHGLPHRRGLWRVEQLGADRGGGRHVAQSFDRQHEPLERDTLDLGRLLRLDALVMRMLGDEMESDTGAAAPGATTPLLGIRARDEDVVQ